MKNFLLVLTMLSSSLFAEIREVSSFAELETRANEETLVLVDLDNCLFEATTSYGHANWFYEGINEAMATGKSKEEAITDFYPRWVKAQEIIEVKPIDPKAIEVITALQEQGVPVIGFTHRQPSVAAATHRQLASLDLAFTKVSESCTLDYTHSPEFNEGVLFIHDLNDKGAVLAAFLNERKIQPKEILFIDDGRHHLQSVEKSAKAMGIAYTGLHLPYDSKGWSYNHKLAVYQERMFPQDAYLVDKTRPKFQCSH